MRAVRRRHVFGHRGEAAHDVAQNVCRDALAPQQHLQRAGRDAQFHGSADMLVRHRVVMALVGHVVVDVDPRRLELRKHHRHCWQRLQGRCVQRREGRRPAAGQALERTLVEFDEQLRHGTVELDQAEEAPMAHASQNPALDHLHPHLDLGLILGPPRPCGQQRGKPRASAIP
jgi:hypothetical protein